jgi:hypothetical protein
VTNQLVRIERNGGAFRLYAERSLRVDVERVFAFFAEPRNLELITPPWLRFRIVGEPPPLAAGTLIEYRLRLHGIPVGWQTEIATWRPPLSFVDIQRRGPFRRWIHRHTFQPDGDTTLIQDVVDYTMPLPVMAQRLLVGRDLRAIFAYRHEAVAALLGRGEDAGT